MLFFRWIHFFFSLFRASFWCVQQNWRNWRIVGVDTGSTPHTQNKTNLLDATHTSYGNITRTVAGISHERTAHTAAYLYHVREHQTGLTLQSRNKFDRKKQQVIAWEDKSDGGNSTSPASSLYASTVPPNATTTTSSGGGAVVLRYGVVVIGGSAEAGEGGAEDDDVPGDQRGSGRVGQGLRHVRVKLTPGRVDTLLSTQVCAFGGSSIDAQTSGYVASMKAGTKATNSFP